MVNILHMVNVLHSHRPINNVSITFNKPRNAISFSQVQTPDERLGKIISAVYTTTHSQFET